MQIERKQKQEEDSDSVEVTNSISNEFSLGLKSNLKCVKNMPLSFAKTLDKLTQIYVLSFAKKFTKYCQFLVSGLIYNSHPLRRRKIPHNKHRH